YRRRSLGQLLLYLATGLILFYLIFPVFVVIPVSFSSAKFLQFPPPGFSLQWYDKYFSRRDWTDATLLSLRIGAITAVLATILGANRWQTFFKVTLPIIRPGVLAGALFAFITSFDELIVALFISGSTAVTLPRKMWDGLRMEIDPTIAAVSTLLIVVSVLVLV